MYRVLISKRARKQLSKIPLKHQRKIKKAIDYLARDPYVGKKLRGEYVGKYSLRVWPYRIVYKIEKKKITVFVLAVGHRQGVY